jgi:hypothetical protein
MHRFAHVVMTAVVATTVTVPAHAEQWVASWTASALGPYPVGNPSQIALCSNAKEAAHG